MKSLAAAIARVGGRAPKRKMQAVSAGSVSPDDPSRAVKHEHADAPFLIVVTTGENADFIFLDLANKAVFFVDTAGLAPGKLML